MDKDSRDMVMVMSCIIGAFFVFIALTSVMFTYLNVWEFKSKLEALNSAGLDRELVLAIAEALGK